MWIPWRMKRLLNVQPSSWTSGDTFQTRIFNYISLVRRRQSNECQDYALNSLKCFRHNYSSFCLMNEWLRLVSRVAIMKKSMCPVGVTAKPFTEITSWGGQCVDLVVWSEQWMEVSQCSLTSIWTVVQPECRRQSDTRVCIWSSVDIDSVKISKLLCRVVW